MDRLQLVRARAAAPGKAVGVLKAWPLLPLLPRLASVPAPEASVA
ncbi:MAG: hypothetical protein ACO3WN_04855 [Burkholderiaceae bacterium]